jgi:hypothetical protein
MAQIIRQTPELKAAATKAFNALGIEITKFGSLLIKSNVQTYNFGDRNEKDIFNAFIRYWRKIAAQLNLNVPLPEQTLMHLVSNLLLNELYSANIHSNKLNIDPSRLFVFSEPTKIILKTSRRCCSNENEAISLASTISKQPIEKIVWLIENEKFMNDNK